MNKAGVSNARVPSMSATQNLVAGESEDVFAFPLSYAQQRLWFLSQLDPGSSVYNVPIAVRLTGLLHVDALRRALVEVVRRHEVLRTRFVTIGNEPMQVVGSVHGPCLEVENLAGLPRAERDTEAIRRATKEANATFDLSLGPLLRAHLLQLAEQEHVLLLTMHHIVSDAWSTGVLVQEMSALYEAFTQNRPSPLPELQLQYADYAVWQREWLQGPVLQKQIEYWRGRLEGLPVLELPTKGLRPVRPSHVGATLQIHVPSHLLTRLKELAREEDATLFMLLLTGFQLLLSRWTGQQDVAVGTPVANRTHLETERLIGFFVNTLVLRVDFGGSPTAREMLRRVREVCRSAYAHQDMPFERLVEELNPQRDLGHATLFQVMFGLKNVPSENFRMGELKLESVPQGAAVANFDLDVLMQEGKGELYGAVTYATELFEAATIHRMLGHWKRLLESIAGNPNRGIFDLQMLEEEEIEQVLVNWNHTDQPHPEARCVQELFEAQVKRSPTATAIMFEGQALTYTELNGYANRLAHHLRTLGVGPEVPVALFLERGLEMAVGLLGILKSGGVYVPLDPDYPADRVAFMLEDAQAPVLITKGHLHQRIAKAGAQIVEIDTVWTKAAEGSQENPRVINSVENAAYVIYTSGSTGRPKGVVASHRGLMNTLMHGVKAFAISGHDVMAALSSFAFDISLLEMMTTWLAGAGTLILSRKDVVDVDVLSERLNSVTVLHTVPSLMGEIVKTLRDSAPEKYPSKLRSLLIGGDQVNADLLAEMNELFPHCQIRVLYGPTEATIICANREIGGETRVNHSLIGCPIANTQMYLLNSNLGPTPIGVTGELYIAGAGLVRGYLRQADLTAERFIPSPFSKRPGERLYQTGDLGRWHVDGTVEFIGRADQQVKLRGHRIELGEVECALREHLRVQDAVVIARKDHTGQNSLAAYVVGTAEGECPTAAELRMHLQERLPEYMIPSVFVKIKTLPLTPTGKLDRRALPDVATPATGIAAARTPVEEILCGIWCRLLNLKQVGVEDNFFDLGGHSLLATQVVSHVRRAFGVRIALWSLFESPTVAGLARVIEIALRAGARDNRPPLVRMARQGDLYLSYAQQRLWFIDQLEPGSSMYNIPTAVRLTGNLQIEALNQALADVVRRHEVLRTRFAMSNGHPVQVIDPPPGSVMEVVDLSGRSTAEQQVEIQHYSAEQATTPFDLGRGPLLRLLLLTLREDEHVLLLTMHHIVSDAWSIGVLVREVAALYEAFVHGEPSPLPELKVQYGDYAIWQRAWLQGEVLRLQVEYWREQLSMISVLELPADRPRPRTPSHRGAAVPVHLTLELLGQLKELNRQEGVTLFMVLFAAFQLVLSRWSGQQDVTVGTPVANRTDAELEDLIGFFVNNLVLRTRLSGDLTTRQLLQRVREVCLAAYAHQDLPFEQLVDEINPERDLAYTPLFQAVFTLQNAPFGKLRMGNLKLEPISSGKLSAQFDLDLDLGENDRGLSGVLIYATDLFVAQTAERLLEHWQRLLVAMAHDPSRQISELEMLSAEERRQVLVEWNETKRAYPGHCVHQLFEQQAAQTPTAVAVIFEDQELTYQELNARGNQLACHLRRLGIGPETCVGLCVERSLEMVIGLLGILKAGGAYVPLDPEYPLERLALMIEETQTPLVLTQTHLLGALGNTKAQVFLLDNDWPQVESLPSGNLPVVTEAENAAYVLYTSGSSGRPKGVVVTHRGIVRLVRNTNYVRLDREQVILQFAPLAFDASTFEIWGSLLNGGKLVVFSGLAQDVSELGRVLGNSGITTLWLTAGLFHLMVGQQLADLAGLRQLIAGGDVLGMAEVQRVLEGLPHCQLINGYGPTEGTTFSCCHRFVAADAGGDAAPLGQPISNTQVYVLDERMEPSAVGVAGELYLGGAGLARGYLGRADWTAERFVPNPFSAEGDGRLYRTGDVGRWRSDGTIAFVGRADEQVKIRGYRIEPGEIEAALKEYSSIEDVVVTARQDEQGGKRLVAYVVGREGKMPGLEEMRAHLREQLPEYMVPGTYVELKQLPLTANGKVDRRALPEPEGMRPKLRQEFQGPRTEVERIFCEIWGKVLGLERVGVEDNFFELGGDSIQCVQIVAQSREAGLQVSVQQMFHHQTIAELALQVQQVSPESQTNSPLPLTGIVPLTPIQSWFFGRELAVPSHFNQSVMLRVPASLGLDVVETVLRRLFESHDALRLRFSRKPDGQWQQIYGDWQVGDAILECFDLSNAPEEERRALLEAEANRLQASLDLEKGPLLRAGWFELGGEKPRLLLVMHHLIVDGVSWRILLGDLQMLCRQVKANEPLRLPFQSASFGHWAKALEEHSQSRAMKGEMEYWLQVARNATQPLRRDMDGTSNTIGSTAFVQLHLSAEETQALLHQLPRTYHTQIQDVLLTALARGFARWGGSKGLLLELEGHGREELSTTLDVSRTVGWFTTMFPVYLRLEGEGLGEDLKAVKEYLRGIPQRGLGYGVLRYLTPEGRRGLKTAPEVVFNYLGQLDQVLNDGDWQPAPESPGAMQNETQERDHLLEINGHIRGGCLTLAFAYSRNIHHEETIQALAAACLDELRALIAHCCAAESSFTPSDFPLARLTQKELDRISQERKLEDLYPLSPMQEGMLSHALDAPNSGVYMIQLCVELEGAWDKAIFLRRAWEQVMQRHAVLRTSFVWEGLERPLQRVEPVPELPWDDQDWCSLQESEQRQKLNRYLEEDRTRGFDLGQAPLMRIGLIRTGQDRMQLVWTHHHLLLDGWSLPPVLGEVLQFYDSHRAGMELQLPAPRSYRDYIAWLQRQDLNRAEGFWREVLKGFLNPTQLGIERRHSKEITVSHFGRKNVQLDRKLSEELKALAQEQRLTLNTVAQGSWGLLLSRYSGQQDVVFGATTAARPVDLPGVEQIIGLFINTLPVRLRVDEKDSVLDCLRGLQQQQVEARRYEYTPLVSIQGWSEAPRNQLLFQTILVFENYPVTRMTGPQTGGMRLLASRTEESTNYPLTASVASTNDLALQIAYDGELFDGETVERMLGHWRHLLGEMVKHLQDPVYALEMLSAEERSLLLEEFNATAVSLPEKTLVGLFEEQVERTPETRAVQLGMEWLTYRQLNQRANQLGHYLRRMGVRAEVAVGLCVERGLEMVIAMLGVLKAGGAYVPLDAAYPAERLRWMLEDMQPAVLLTESRIEGGLPPFAGKAVRLDQEWDEISRSRDENILSEVKGENLAYAIYTSGSSGRPKAVGITHSSAAVLIRWAGEEFTANELSGVLASTSICFDLSVYEIFVPLSQGGKVVMAENALELGTMVGREEVKLVNTVPSVMQELVRSGGLPGSVVAVNLAGEALTTSLVRQVYGVESIRRVVNLYGPSEGTTYSTYAWLRKEEAEAEKRATVRIGKPILNTQAYVVDERMHLVPVGVAGELCIGGAGLARGYVNRPELTAERFVPDPFAREKREAGRRLYRTGDLVRWLPDGNLEFLGRVDYQVKIRGFRIELGEIEAVLQEHGEVKQAVVIVREDEPGDKQLVAYVVMGRGEGTRVENLRAYMQGRLPNYMLPGTIVELEQLPLTPNGKVNRKALPAPVGARRDLGQGYRAQRTPTEELLCSIWAQILGLKTVGTEDDFFELGGHSLLATRVVSRIRQVFGVELKLRDVFEQPTVARLATTVEAAQKAGGMSKAPPLVRVPRDGMLPLSYAQQRLWFMDQLEPGSVAYIVPAAVRMIGPLHLHAFSRALDEIVRRHEALRTRFTVVDGQAVQSIDVDSGGQELIQVDLSGLTEGEREEAMRKHMAEVMTPFDLSRGPLLRVRVVTLGDDNHALMMTMHHIISDGWSMGLLIYELTSLYEAFVQGQGSPLPELEIQYADYASWQREWLSHEILEGQLSYWRNQLADVPVLELSAGKARPSVSSHKGASVPILVPPELLERMRKLSRQEGTTLFMMLLAGFQLLLSRYSGQEDIAVGTDVANRTRTEVEQLIGFFVNQLVLRTDTSGNSTVLELLARVREVCLGAYAHQDLPFERLVEEINPERSLSHTPLFQVKLLLQNLPSVQRPFAGAQIKPLNIASGASQFDLLLSLEEAGEFLSGRCTYATDLFDELTVERMVGHWRRLLEGMVVDAERRIGELEMLSEEELRQVLVEWNGNREEYGGGCVHEWFEQQAKRTPEAVAVECGGEKVSYEELNRRANQVGHYLRRMGVEAETRVGVCVGRKVEMVVGLLGVMKAGGAYVPLDGGYPRERLGYMVEETGAGVILTEERMEGRLPVSWGRVVCLDREREEIGGEGEENVGVRVEAENAAYVMYTSGSSGRPKGVVVTHGGLMNYLRWSGKEYGKDGGRRAGGIGRGDSSREGGEGGGGKEGRRGGRGKEEEQGWGGVPVHTSISFDLTVTSLYLPLLHGGRVVLVEEGEEGVGASGVGASGVGGMEGLMEKLKGGEKFDWVKLTPSHLDVLAGGGEGVWEGMAKRVGLVILGGEALSWEQLEEWRKRDGGRVRWINEYGPTETVVGCSVYEVKEGEGGEGEGEDGGVGVGEIGGGVEVGGEGKKRGRGSVAIGRGIANMQMYVLDRRMEVVPVGVKGEIYIGGVGLARGYMKGAEMTAERFVPNPYGERAGERMYRTGDLGRWRADGELEYIGRRDDQVKVRGYRIELGEIEVALREQGGVKEAAVVVREGEGGEKRLVAYVVREGGEQEGEQGRGKGREGDGRGAGAGEGEGEEGERERKRRGERAEEWRKYLQERLPGYMVPGWYVEMEALPLTRNGKVDRKGLPEPERGGKKESYEGPRNAVEEMLCGIWEKVLKLERVGIRDNFFELGGHSLLATQVISQMRKLWGVELSLRVLFEASTVAGLAEAAESAQREGKVEIMPPLLPVGRERPLPLSYAQQRLWFIDKLEPESTAYNLPMAVRLKGELNVKALERTLLEIMRRHEALRTHFDLLENQPVQVIGEPLEFPLDFEDLTGAPLEECEARVLSSAAAESVRKFNLEQGPLVRAHLVRIREEDHVLLLAMHHIVSDGWSLGVLVKEVAALYDAYSKDQPSPLPELEIQYADFAVWQRGWLQGNVLEEQVEYWRRQLADLEALELATDHPRPPILSHRGASVPFHLTRESTSPLKALSRQEEVTIFMVLLASFQLVLSRWSGQEDLAVGSAVANRARAELEDLIGFFVNTLVLRGDLSGDPTVAELLARVREVCLGAYAHQDLPFEQLVEELNPERNMSRTPLFQVLLVLQNAPVGGLRMEGLELSRIPAPGDLAVKFDMDVLLQEMNGEISGTLHYASDLFEKETMQRLVEHWQRLLAGMTADAERRISTLDMLGETEKRQLVEEWNYTPHLCSGRPCVHELLEDHAKQTPKSVAVICANQRLTYEELNAQANQLGHYLRNLGVGPEVRVGICMERSLDLVVGLFGIMKAGGAYVPMDPEYPAERLAFMLKDAQAALVLTQGHLLGHLEGTAEKIVCLDTDREAITVQSKTNLPSILDIENAAYVIYTSGSTGRPKGSIIQHSSLTVLCEWAYQIFSKEELAQVLASSSICFDMSVFELFVPLSGGNTIHLVSNFLALSDSADATVTMLETVPSVLGEVLKTMELPGSVRTVGLAGEPLPRWLVERLHDAGVQRVFNLYGLSECTVYSTWALLNQKDHGRVPIGRPVSNTQVYVLDGRMKPVPVGVVGELYIGGAGVGRGYLNRPGLTAEKFVPNPLGQKNGERLYRSGDLARWLATGELECLGRADHQVKIRGFRIELGEIEAVLLQNSEIEDAAVILREDQPGQTKLVAYVVGQAGTSIQIAKLQQDLRQWLPQHMVPNVFVQLERLPLMPNGKLNRQALPRPETGEQYVAPRERIELEIANIWERYLGVQPISIRDNFFNIGGNSLSAFQVIHTINRRLESDVPVAVLFQNPTIEGLGRVVRERECRQGLPSPVITLQPRSPVEGAGAPVFCVHPAGGFAFCYLELARLLAAQHPVYGLQSPGMELNAKGGLWLVESMEALAGKYADAIKAIEPQGPYHIAGWSFGGMLALEIARQLQEKEGNVCSVALIDSSIFGFHPELAEKDPYPADDAELLAEMFFQANRPSFQPETTPDERIIALLNHAKSRDLIPAEADIEWGRRVANVIKGHLDAAGRYVPSRYRGRITFFRAIDGPEDQFEIEFSNLRRLATEGLEIHDVPGDHGTIVQGQGIAKIAQWYLQNFKEPIPDANGRADRRMADQTEPATGGLSELLESVEIEVLNKLKNSQSGTLTFFDGLVLETVQTVRSGESLLRQSASLQGEHNERRQRLIEMQTAISSFAQSKAQPRFLPYGQRFDETRRHTMLPWEITDIQFSATQGVDECLLWRGMPLFKTVFDFALYPMMIWEARPKTIIELGSGLGTSAIWYADLLDSFGMTGQVLSVDIQKINISKPGVTFIQGDCEKIEEAVPLSFLEGLPHPWLVIEDAHVNTAGILIHFRQCMRQWDYLIVEDSMPKIQALTEFMREFGSEFRVDRKFTDFFGRNATCSKDSIFVRI